MKKIRFSSKQTSILFLPFLLILLLLLTWSTIEPVSAHSGRLHLPFTLPSCTARVLVCEVPSSSALQTQDQVQTQTAPAALLAQDEHHCVDGAGVPRSCAMNGPFRYMPQNLALEKGSVTAAQTLDAMSETPCVNGLAGTYPCSNVDLLSFLPMSSIGGGFGNDIWGWTDPTTGGEYVVMGRRNGTSFVDISDPTNPVYLGNLPSEDGVDSIWRDVKVYKNHAYIVVDDFPSSQRTHGMQIFDLTQLSASSTISTQVPITFSATAVYDEVYGAHNLAINEESGFAYVLGSRHSADIAKQCDGGLHMVDINNPAAPTFAGCFSDDGYTHDTQCVIYDGPDTAYQGREICFSSNEDSLTIVDVTVKNSPMQIAKARYYTDCPAVGDCNRNEFGQFILYSHQGWLTEDHAYFVQDDEIDERGFGTNTRTYMWNVEDLDNPQYIGDYLADIESYDHNLYIRDNFIYEANYRSGLRILDASNIASASLNEVAFFDTFPAADGLEYDGAWSSYPFFESGVVAISTIGEGLFVVRPKLDEIGVLKIYMPIVQQD